MVSKARTGRCRGKCVATSLSVESNAISSPIQVSLTNLSLSADNYNYFYLLITR